MTDTAPNQTLTNAAGTLQPAAPIEVGQHTMGVDSLLRYLRIKVHHLVQEHDWERIHVIGGYNRARVISRFEKPGKLFNWQRPTAEACGRELLIRCFPGTDYVHHYGLIIATYLHMVGRHAGRVTYRIPTPESCQEAVDQVALDLDGDLVIVGWGLEHLAPTEGPWNYGLGYAWKRARVRGRSVLYLGFLHSIWGDVAGRVVARLATLGAGDVVYVGKVGALDPAVVPNTRLATGNVSLIGGVPVAWSDFFGSTALNQHDVLTGVHVTSSSVLLENRDWLSRNSRHAFVDPEIGPMGAAAQTAGISFGYLHVVSNNLARHYPEDLSNERHRQVIRQRAELVERVRAIIATRLAAER
ncbi:hypothetical protein [Nocardiopsis sp. HUAS JQ3]|uniref:hypothetical protein n=1 Tax=Nocardiopsis sp. HUAS JQ3 TaxID=3061629 RepID=UPI0023AA00F1|nr:hypothetical protein [Nocardiopsis sp. HUAS JQ3]WDZ90592.1 hypothetical protein PV789_27515 [Nocardiopsis sp. HUAS JQ3]